MNAETVARLRRLDAYCVAARALMARALGCQLPPHVALGPFSKTRASGAISRVEGVSLIYELSFYVGASAVTSILEHVDESGGQGSVDDYDLGDMLSVDDFYRPLAMKTVDRFGSAIDRDAMLDKAWREAFEFLSCSWSFVGRIAEVLIERGGIRESGIPRLSWPNTVLIGATGGDGELS